jgi:hypothetical protein
LLNDVKLCVNPRIDQYGEFLGPIFLTHTQSIRPAVEAKAPTSNMRCRKAGHTVHCRTLLQSRVCDQSAKVVKAMPALHYFDLLMHITHFINLYHVISRITTNHSFPLAKFVHILTRSKGFCDARPLSWSDLPDRSDLPRKSQNIHPQRQDAWGQNHETTTPYIILQLYVNICRQCYIYIYRIYNSSTLMKLGKELEGKSLS